MSNFKVCVMFYSTANSNTQYRVWEWIIISRCARKYLKLPHSVSTLSVGNQNTHTKFFIHIIFLTFYSILILYFFNVILNISTLSRLSKLYLFIFCRIISYFIDHNPDITIMDVMASFRIMACSAEQGINIFVKLSASTSWIQVSHQYLLFQQFLYK